MPAHRTSLGESSNRIGPYDAAGPPQPHRPAGPGAHVQRPPQAGPPRPAHLPPISDLSFGQRGALIDLLLKDPTTAVACRRHLQRVAQGSGDEENLLLHDTVESLTKKIKAAVSDALAACRKEIREATKRNICLEIEPRKCQAVAPLIPAVASLAVDHPFPLLGPSHAFDLCLLIIELALSGYSDGDANVPEDVGRALFEITYQRYKAEGTGWFAAAKKKIHLAGTGGKRAEGWAAMGSKGDRVLGLMDRLVADDAAAARVPVVPVPAALPSALVARSQDKQSEVIDLDSD